MNLDLTCCGGRGWSKVSHLSGELIMAAYASTASSKILLAFQALSEDERHRVQLQLLEGTEVYAV